MESSYRPVEKNRWKTEIIDEDNEGIIKITSGLKNNKTPGIGGKRPEIIKYTSADVWEEIFQIVFDVWTSENIPEKW